MCQQVVQVLAHRRDCSGIALRKTGYGGAPASERQNALLSRFGREIAGRIITPGELVPNQYVDEGSSMDRDAGAAGPGVGGCYGFDPDSTIGTVEPRRLTRAQTSDRRRTTAVHGTRDGCPCLRLGRTAIFPPGAQTSRPLRRHRFQLRNAPGYRASGSGDAREQEAICSRQPSRRGRQNRSGQNRPAAETAGDRERRSRPRHPATADRLDQGATGARSG